MYLTWFVCLYVIILIQHYCVADLIIYLIALQGLVFDLNKTPIGSHKKRDENVEEHSFCLITTLFSCYLAPWHGHLSSSNIYLASNCFSSGLSPIIVEFLTPVVHFEVFFVIVGFLLWGAVCWSAWSCHNCVICMQQFLVFVFAVLTMWSVCLFNL